MSYSGSDVARGAREELGKALASLQEDPNTPPDVMNLAQNIAQAVGALFEAEKAADERGGKGAVRTALGSLSQTMALLQDVRSAHQGVTKATSSIAGAMSRLHPLTSTPSIAPPPPAMIAVAPAAARPVAAPVAVAARPVASAAAAPAAPVAHRAPSVRPPVSGPRTDVEANVGASSETNFYVGFSGEISEGGVFVATYNTLAVGAGVNVTVTLPGGFEFKVPGYVHFVRDPMDLMADSEPGMGVRFEQLGSDHRELVLRFIRKRAPMFYDD